MAEKKTLISEKILALSFILIGLSGCTTFMLHKKSGQVDIAQVWMNQTAAVEVLEAFSGADEMYLKYRAFLKDSDQSHIFYTLASWDPEKNKSIDLVRNLVVPLEFMEENDWLSQPGHLRAVPVLSQEHWHNFRGEFVRGITPKEENAGIVISVDQAELLFYYGEDNKFTVKDVAQKPDNVSVIKIISESELAQEVVPALKDYLLQLDKNYKKVLMVTHNDRYYSSPFLYLDLENEFAVNLKVESKAQRKYRENLIKKGVQSADLLIVDSHMLGVLTRPLSSSLRLFTIGKERMLDIIRPTEKLASSPLAMGNILEKRAIPPLFAGGAMDLNVWEDRLDKLVGRNVAYGRMKFLIGGDKFFPRLIETLLDAKESIDLRIFIFDNDDYAVKLADILKRKSKEKGLDVRVLLDGLGKIMGEGKTPEDLPADFIPPDSMARYLKKDSKIKVRLRPNTWFKADHTKTITVDNKLSFTGGMNIGREYRYKWHDMMIELEGPVVDLISRDFNLAWAHASSFGDFSYIASMLKTETPGGKGDGYPIRLLYTKLNDPQIFKAQMAAIRAAKKYIYIENAYLSDNQILRALIDARARGVDVRVIFPVNGNHEIMNASNLVTANTMFKHGIRVYFYPGMSHIKAAVYDGWLTTGSANFDKLSLRDNLELNLATSDAETVAHFNKILFEKDFRRSKEMTEPIKHGLKEYLAEFLAEQL